MLTYVRPYSLTDSYTLLLSYSRTLLLSYSLTHLLTYSLAYSLIYLLTRFSIPGTIHAKRVTIMPKDIQLARRIRGPLKE